MRSGKFDEELVRMSAIADNIHRRALVLFNESFAATHEREGAEIARQVTSALLDNGVTVFFCRTCTNSRARSLMTIKCCSFVPIAMRVGRAAFACAKRSLCQKVSELISTGASFKQPQLQKMRVYEYTRATEING